MIRLSTQLSTNGMTLPQLVLADDLLLPTVIEPVIKKVIINLGFLAPEAPLLNFPQIQGTINWTQNHSYVI